MNYDTIDDLVAADDDATRERVVPDIVGPVLSQSEDVSWEIDPIIVADDFLKCNLMDVFNYLIVRVSAGHRRVAVNAHYVDTLPTIEEDTFVKTRVLVTINGDVRENDHSYDVTVRTKPFEVV